MRKKLYEYMHKLMFVMSVVRLWNIRICTHAQVQIWHAVTCSAETVSGVTNLAFRRVRQVLTVPVIRWVRIHRRKARMTTTNHLRTQVEVHHLRRWQTRLSVLHTMRSGASYDAGDTSGGGRSDLVGAEIKE